MTKLDDDFAKRFPLEKTQSTGVVVAALDMGSNSFHLVVVRGHAPTQFDILLKEKVMMRLGDEVARTGKISSETSAKIKDTVATMANLARGVGATEMVALATAAFRDAKNSGAIVDDLEESLGVKVSVISGKREAELIWGAISHGVDFGGETIIGADLGGGSLEITVGTQDNLLYSQSFNVGVGRLTAEFKDNKSSTGINASEIIQRLVKVLGPSLSKITKDFNPTKLVLSSGSFLNIAKMAIIRETKGSWGDHSINQARLKSKSLNEVIQDLSTMDLKTRTRLPGIDEKRVDLLPAASLVAKMLLERIAPQETIACEWALREGIILRELSLRNESEFSENPESVKLESILGVTKRYGWNEGHARQVSRLALQLFDQTTELHQLNINDREILKLASLVHDIGEYISVEGHDRHGAYLLENSRLAGFDKNNKNMLVSVVRFHRRGTPKTEYVPYSELQKEDANKVTKLAAILRLADALDRSHTRLVDSVTVVLHNNMMLLCVDAKHEVELEEYGLRRKRQLFEETFGVEVHLVQNPTVPNGH